MSMSSYEYFRCLRWYCTIGRYGLVDDECERFAYEHVKDLIDRIEIGYLELAGLILTTPKEELGFRYLAKELGFTMEEVYRLLLWAQMSSKQMKPEMVIEDYFKGFQEDCPLYNYKTTKAIEEGLKEIARNG